jgi:hypothetical protein
MALSLTNSKDLVVNSITVVKGNRAIDLVDTLDAVTGIAPDTLNSLQKPASALNNDSNFFNFVTNGLEGKADVSTTYTRLVTDGLLDAKVDDTEMTNYALKTDVATAVSTKQATLSTGLASTGSQSILSGTTIKTIVPGTGISLSSTANGITVTGIDFFPR